MPASATTTSVIYKPPTVCVCRCRVHPADAAGQSELLHQPLDLLCLLQQRLSGAPPAAALSQTQSAQRLLAQRLHHHTHLQLVNNYTRAQKHLQNPVMSHIRHATESVRCNSLDNTNVTKLECLLFYLIVV